MFYVFCRLLMLFKIIFFEILFQEYYQSAKQVVGPDLGLNCLQRLSAYDISKQLAKVSVIF